MCPYPSHNAILIAIQNACSNCLCDVKLIDGPSIHMNSHIQSDDFTTIPNFQIQIETCWVDTVEKPVSLWVGQSGFSSDEGAMIRKMQKLVQHNPYIDVVFIISIKEEPWKVPSDIATPLHAQPKISCEDFVPKCTMLTSMGPVIARDVNWLKVNEVTYSIKGETRMDDVVHLFNVGAAHLISHVTRLMEGKGIDPTRVQCLRDVLVSLHFDWEHVLDTLSCAVYNTTYIHYSDWYECKPTKRKHKEEPATSEEQQV
ncbi:hypothetical protein HYDPIDRAFT_168200 [Hydnomerulius pinastri MD-312]|uniref:Uncharacterized protein n=1 Tax=Hydnomerulius pinastri MD-312 TaxID=994086 RepID=A0A0C9WEX1_9AGAM|nr:hypothetical protein HYDPIDRAFT_168200 [Hydnomerulius pinastri MD-312]